MGENPDGPSSDLYQEQLDDLKLEQERIEDELEYCKKRKETLENRKVVDDDTYKTILNEFLKLWDESDSKVKEDLMKTVIQSLIFHVDNDNTGDIVINLLADKKLEAEWTEIKKCEPGKIRVRTSGMPCSTYTDGMRKIFSLKWPIRVLRRGSKGNKCEIDYQKLLNLYPNFNDANQKFYTEFVNSEPSKKKKKRKSRAEQRKIYRELLDSGKVKNQAEIARKFGVSRAWVSKVLS